MATGHDYALRTNLGVIKTSIGSIKKIKRKKGDKKKKKKKKVRVSHARVFKS